MAFSSQKDGINKAQFEQAWYALLAEILEKPRAEVEQRELHQQIRQRNKVIFISSAVVVVLGIAVGVALWQRSNAIENADLAKQAQQRAEKQKTFAVSRQLAAQANLKRRDHTWKGLEQSLLLATESLRQVQTLEGYFAWAEAISHHPKPLEKLSLMGDAEKIIFSHDGKLLVTIDSTNVIQIWDWLTHELIKKFKHNSAIRSGLFSPKNQWFAILDYNGKVKLWQTNNWEEPPLPDPEDPVKSTAFSPDGNWLVVGGGKGGSSGYLKVWDLLSHKVVFEGNGDPWKHWVNAVVFSPDGEYLVAGGGYFYRSDVRVWKTSDWEQVFRQNQGPWVHTVIFGKDKNQIIVGRGDPESSNGEIEKWTFVPNKLLLKEEQPGLINGLALSPDKKWLATRSASNVIIWEAETFRKKLDIDLRNLFLDHYYEDLIADFAMSPKENLIVVSSIRGGAFGWEIPSGKKVLKFPSIKNLVTFTASGRLLASGGFDKTVHLYPIEQKDRPLYLKEQKDRPWEIFRGGSLNEKSNASFQIRFDSSISQLQYSLDGNLLVAHGKGLNGKTLDIWNTRTWKLAKSINIERYEGIETFMLSPQSDQLLTLWMKKDPLTDKGANAFHEIQVWNVGQWELPIKTFKIAKVEKTIFSPNAKLLVTYSKDKTIRIYEIPNGAIFHEIPNQGDVHDIMISPSSEYLALTKEDGTLEVWQINSEKPLARLSSKNSSGVMAFHPSDDLLAIGDNEGLVTIFDYSTGQEVVWEQAHLGKITSMAFTKDGQSLITESYKTTSIIWDVDSGTPQNSLKHQGVVTAVTYSPDSKFVVTGSDQKIPSGKLGAVRVWEVQTGHEIARMEHEDSVTQVTFSPNGDSFATGSEDGTFRVWRWKREDLIRESCSRLWRNFYQVEWEEFLFDAPYQKTCSDLPIPD